MTKSFPTRRAYDVGLAVARRTVEIDDHRSIAMGRERLGIPAIGPAIAEAALRPAMDQHGYRQLACYTLRLHDLAPDGVAVRALEAVALRSEEHTSELQSLMRISYAVFCLYK